MLGNITAGILDYCFSEFLVRKLLPCRAVMETVWQQCSSWLEILWSFSLHTSEFLIPHVAVNSLIFKDKLCFCSQSANLHKQLEVTGLHRRGEQGVKKS